jgi:hypothetical protein
MTMTMYSDALCAIVGWDNKQSTADNVIDAASNSIIIVTG